MYATSIFRMQPSASGSDAAQSTGNERTSQTVSGRTGRLTQAHLLIGNHFSRLKARMWRSVLTTSWKVLDDQRGQFNLEGFLSGHQQYNKSVKKSNTGCREKHVSLGFSLE